jgi:hypothetical protein
MKQLNMGQDKTHQPCSRFSLQSLQRASNPSLAKLAWPGRAAPAEPRTLRLPPELPNGLRCVLQLTDVDAVSHGLVDGTALRRASDEAVRMCLGQVHATATALDPRARVRYAASSKTARHHLNVLTASGNNVWTVRRGLDGADYALLEELTNLLHARLVATRPGRKRPGRVADVVILVAQDRIYADHVRQLRVAGIPTWLMVPGHLVAASLYRAGTAVTFIGPRPGSPGRVANSSLVSTPAWR